MGRFNVSLLRYLDGEDFRVLQAVEMGMKNHEFVPLQLLCAIAKIKASGMKKRIGDLIKHRLLAYEKSGKSEGYRLTNLGYDFLALNALRAGEVLASIGNQIGVGKESDVYIGTDPKGAEVVVKIHRLGRTSFRKVKEKRDYHGKRRSPNWLYLSRLAALKEHAFMEALYNQTPPFPVPVPHGLNRHVVVMSVVPGVPLARVAEVPDVGVLHSQLMELVMRLAAVGLIHSDFNEFNLLLREDNAAPILIDFPQMVSTSHANAAMYFERDVRCINEFFRKRFGFEAEEAPTLADVETTGEALDTQVAASGWKNELGEEYESGDEDAIRNYSSFSDTDDEDEAPQAVPILPVRDPVAAWVEKAAEATPAVHFAVPDVGAAVEDAGAVGDDEEGDEEVESRDDVRSIVTTSTIAPAEIRNRLRKQVTQRNQSEELKKALKKTSKVNARRARIENRETVKEYDGWLD